MSFAPFHDVLPSFNDEQNSVHQSIKSALKQDETCPFQGQKYIVTRALIMYFFLKKIAREENKVILDNCKKESENSREFFM